MQAINSGLGRGARTTTPGEGRHSTGAERDMNIGSRYDPDAQTVSLRKDGRILSWAPQEMPRHYLSNTYNSVIMKSKQHPVPLTSDVMKCDFPIVNGNRAFDSLEARKVYDKGHGYLIWPPGYKKKNRDETFDFAYIHDKIQKETRDELYYLQSKKKRHVPLA